MDINKVSIMASILTITKRERLLPNSGHRLPILDLLLALSWSRGGKFIK